MATTENPSNQWRRIDGVDVMPEIQQRYLEWLLAAPEDKGGVLTHADWAEANGTTDRATRRWRKDPRFLAAWRDGAREINVSPERSQAVMENLFRIASGGSDSAAVKAAETYLKFLGMLEPPTVKLVQDGSLDKFSDEELRRLLAEENA